MKSKRLMAVWKVSAFWLTVIGLSDMAFAHHSFSMFDRSTEQVVTAKVVRWTFNNPHAWLYVSALADDGTETLWSFESAAPPQLIGRGITGNTFKPGDELTLMFCPLKDNRPGGALGWVKMPDGTFLSTNDGGCDGSANNISLWEERLASGVYLWQRG
jgi:hypothetical protein